MSGELMGTLPGWVKLIKSYFLSVILAFAIGYLVGLASASDFLKILGF